MVGKIFLTGWLVLIVAIAANILASNLGITTWYPFLSDVSKHGFIKTFFATTLVSKLFLFGLYPALLGLSAFVVFKK